MGSDTSHNLSRAASGGIKSKLFDKMMMRSGSDKSVGKQRLTASDGDKSVKLRISDFAPCSPVASKNSCFKNSLSSEQESMVSDTLKKDVVILSVTR